MKECLVITLMLSLTGMVAGQQSVFENTRTDSTRVPGAATDSSATRLPQTDDVDRIMKLDINSSMIDAIKNGQELTASIDLKNVTNGIVMLFDDPTTLKPRVDEVPRNLKPDFVSGNGVLHFSLDEQGLERLRTEGLQYEYLPGEKGKYQEVVLKFAPSGTERSSAGVSATASTATTALPSTRRRPATTSNDQFGSSHRHTGLTGADRTRTTDPASAATRDRFTRDDFQQINPRVDRDMASASTENEADRYFEQQRQLKRQQQRDQQQQVDTRRNYSVVSGQSSRDQNWSSPRINHGSTDNQDKHTFELTDRDIDALALTTQQIREQQDRREAELDRLQREKIASDHQAQRANEDRMRLLQELRDRTSLDETSVARRRSLNEHEFYTPYSQRPLLPSPRHLSRTASLDSQFDPTGRDYMPPVRTSTTASEIARLKLEEAALENERLRYELARAETDRTRVASEQRLANLGDANPNNTTRRSPLRMSDYGASIPGSQRPNDNRPPQNNPQPNVTPVSTNHLMTATAVDHILNSYDGQNFQNVSNRVKAEVAAISDAKTRVDKFNGFLLFLFITFFALSLYLGWLAQSFYGQYGELADELRETFTATT